MQHREENLRNKTIGWVRTCVLSLLVVKLLPHGTEADLQMKMKISLCRARTIVTRLPIGVKPQLPHTASVVYRDPPQIGMAGAQWATHAPGKTLLSTPMRLWSSSAHQKCSLKNSRWQREILRLSRTSLRSRRKALLIIGTRRLSCSKRTLTSNGKWHS